MKKPLIITLVFLLAACSAAPAQPTDPATPVPAGERQTWENAHIAHYRFELTLSCFCAFRDQMPLGIEVKDGTVVSMQFANGESVPADDVNYEFFSQYATIDKLFDKIESARADPEAGDVVVTYDPTHGFPVEASIDYIKLAEDDEMYLTVSGFEALP